MATGANVDLAFHNLRVHAALGVVVQRHKGPVRHGTSNASFFEDKIFRSRCVEELDVVGLQHLGQHRGGEQSGMLDDHVVIRLLRVWNTDLVQELVGWLAHNHSAHELASKPCSTPRSNILFDDRNLDFRVLRKLVGARETSGSSPRDDDIRFGEINHVLHVTAGHSSGYIGLTNGREGVWACKIRRLALLLDHRGVQVLLLGH
mmetsp:Transcript_10093/g.19354  ORF Transcript_10093/g.19354 Transcript_10093/m.19354 type:complete len:204 (+) Transcript_10093:690-1301(+)